jgi:hypothetical protein
VRHPQLSPFEANYVGYFQPSISGRASLEGVDTLPNAQALPAIERQCRPDSADIPTGERAVRRELLHLLRDFSQSAILRHMSGNSADISKGYFEKPIGSLNPLWSASKSRILQEKMSMAQLCRRFRQFSARTCGNWPLRERIGRYFRDEWRSFLITRLCQWPSL